MCRKAVKDRFWKSIFVVVRMGFFQSSLVCCLAPFCMDAFDVAVLKQHLRCKAIVRSSASLHTSVVVR